MRYGEQIGLKFERNGAPRRYMGNTVIADVGPANPAYAVMAKLKKQLAAADLAPLFILLTEDSYHMTVIRGLNDQVRSAAFWPASLPQDAPMTAVDAYVTRAVRAVPPLRPVGMCFDRVRVDGADIRVCLRPQDAGEAEALTSYRDQVAAALGLRLPGHEGYTYHLTLAYTLRLPEGDEVARLAALVAGWDALLSRQPPFRVDAPRLAYYQDMMYFSPVPLPRD